MATAYDDAAFCSKLALARCFSTTSNKALGLRVSLLGVFEMAGGYSTLVEVLGAIMKSGGSF